MPERGQFCGDCSQASPLPGLGRLARQAPSFGNDDIGNRPATLTPAGGCPLGIATMLELGDKACLFELTHGAEDLAHHLGGWGWVGEVGRRIDWHQLDTASAEERVRAATLLIVPER